MRPVAIFRHTPTEGPGYFATFLEGHGIAWELIPVDAGAPVPASPEAYAGLCFMGGPMSVNDPLPWIDHTCALIRNAVAAGIPVLGHCLGGQLMAKALGGQVTPNPIKEIGWGTARIEEGEIPGHWFNGLGAKSPFSSGTAKPSPCRPRPSGCSPTISAPTRCSPWGPTWPCSAMWK